MAAIEPSVVIPANLKNLRRSIGVFISFANVVRPLEPLQASFHVLRYAIETPGELATAWLKSNVHQRCSG